MNTQVLTKKLKINKRKSYMIAQFPLDMRLQDMQPSLSIVQEDLMAPSSQDTPQDFASKGTSSKSTPWRLTSTTIDPVKNHQRTYLSNEEPIESRNYFIIIESKDDIAEIIPVKEFFKFHLQPHGHVDIATSSDFAEKESKQNAAKEVDLAVKVTNLKRNDSDDESKAKKTASIQEGPFIDDDYGIKRQEIKHHKQVLKAKYGNLKSFNDYVNSALAISNLRHNPGTWDYNDGERSDDEVDAFEPPGPQFSDEYTNGDFDKDDDLDSDQEALTGYGKKMKNLLINHANQEVDDELKKYVDDDEETQVTASEQNTKKPDPKLNSGSLQEREVSAPQWRTQSSTTKEEVESKVIRTLMQNMGRMNVQAFMNQIRFKKKDQEIQLYKEAIKKTCDIEIDISSGEKILSLKAAYRN